MKIKSIIWHWNEGKDLGLDGKELTPKRANIALHQVAMSAPISGGYDKVKFTAIFEDGDSYSGRFDVKRYGSEQDSENGELTFEAYISNAVKFYIGDRRPHHMTEEQYAGFIKEYGIPKDEADVWRKRIAA